jgi:hypothetical protein
VKPEIDRLYENAVRALQLFEGANKQRSPLPMSRVMMLGDLAARARQRAVAAVEALSDADIMAAIDEIDESRRMDLAKVGLIGAKPNRMVNN